jgi:hypothetical protein
MFAGALALLLVIVGVWWIVAVNRDNTTKPAPTPATAAGVSPAPSWTRSAPALPGDVTAVWAYLDSTDGSHVRTGDNELHPIDRLIVPGLAQLRANQVLPDDRSADPDEMSVITSALAQNDEFGKDLIKRAGGEAAFGKVLEACSLEADTAAHSPARATILGVAQYAACLREGAITDPERARWMLDYMRVAAGGIGDERGDDGGQRLAQFNSTVPAGDGRNRTWCMGIGAYWTAAVLVDWPDDNGELYGVAACAQVAKAEFPPDTQQASEILSPTPAPSIENTCPFETCRGTD